MRLLRRALRAVAIFLLVTFLAAVQIAAMLDEQEGALPRVEEGES